MNKKLVTLIFVLSAQLSWSQTVSEQLQQKLNNLQTMSASFKQKVKAQHREISSSKGTMALARPGRFRWQTREPMPQLVVADGQRLWIYDEDLEQVTVKKQEKGVGGTAALFLSGYNDSLAQDFKVEANQVGNKQAFDLYPKSHKNNFQHVKLVFNGDTLSNIELFDQLGQHTYVSLFDVKNNPSLNPSVFKFKTPKGVDVVEQ